MVEKMVKVEASEVKAENESDDHESEDESEVLEESPCGRWLKRNEEVNFLQICKSTTSIIWVF